MGTQTGQAIAPSKSRSLEQMRDRRILACATFAWIHQQKSILQW
ncbi:hypothetical protein [Alkalinema sp. FACHB-956]|nr:hypothetical protein [Alkalinema sp. FACHB-956]